MTNNKQVSATLSAHGGPQGSQLVTVEELSRFRTPPATRTWTPVPHADIPTIIDRVVTENGWKFAEGQNKFQLSVTPSGSKMFGVSSIVIPGMLEGEEFGLAIGFRNSHDKSMSLQMAVGTRVFVCDNMMMNGEYKVRREHTVRISVETELKRALEYVPEAAEKTVAWFGGMRQVCMGRDEGVAFLAKCVEYKALPMVDFMDARSSFLNGFADEATIRHGGTLWGAYQAVTEQWKKHSLMQLPEYSHSLNEMVRDRVK